MVELKLIGKSEKGYVLDLKMNADYINKLKRLFNIKVPEIYSMELCHTTSDMLTLMESSMGWLTVCDQIKDGTNIELNIPSHCMTSILNFIRSKNLKRYCRSINFIGVDDILFIEDLNESFNLIA